MAERRKSKRKKPVVFQWIEFAVFRVVQATLRMLPSRLIQRIGAVLGRVAYRVARSRTSLAMRNLASALPELPDAERKRVIVDCWGQFCAETLTYVRTIDAPAEEVRRYAELVNREYLDEALRENRGLILFTAHFGAWESAISVVRSFGIPFAVVARPLDNELLEALLQRSRLRFDVEMIPKRNAARVLMKRLSRKEGVLVLPDQAVHPRQGILVPFLGKPAWTTAAPARLALRFGTPLIGAFCYRRDGKVIAELNPPIHTKDLDETQENVERLTARVNEEISERIRRDPPLWLWMHDRWKKVD